MKVLVQGGQVTLTLNMTVDEYTKFRDGVTHLADDDCGSTNDNMDGVSELFDGLRDQLDKMGDHTIK